MSFSKGKLIVIEGLEGAGKSTAVKTILDLLFKLNIETITTREPGGTPIGELLRTIIKDPRHKDVLHDKSELLLLYTARIQLLEQIIKPALEKGQWVIADRFELSTMAYQGGGRGLDQEMIAKLSSFCLNGFKPDLTLYLDLDPELGMQRASLRGAFDRIEQQKIDFFHRTHTAYMSYIKNNPDIISIDASASLKTVQASIESSINQFIAANLK
ncbi:MAG: dTMP kinase [bacterium]|nr:dTMP kinase [bacterium]